MGTGQWGSSFEWEGTPARRERTCSEDSEYSILGFMEKKLRYVSINSGTGKPARTW
jgi:hypothetical protein